MQLRNYRGNRRDENVLATPLHQVWERLCSRMGNLGTYRLLQINGQRKFFDPLDDSPPIVDGCEVFIGRIPRDMFEDELVPLFAHYGPIHELRLMMNFSGTNRGFAFVMYKQPQFAEEAIRKLNDFEVRRGHFIGVIQSDNNRRLYIGRLHPSSTNEATLLKFLSNLTEGLQSLSLHVMKRTNEKPNRKYAIAVYVSHRHAAMARRFLILRKNEIFHQDVIVDWAWPNIGVHKHDGNEYLCPSDETVQRGTPNATSTPISEVAKTTAAQRKTPQQADAAARLQKSPILPPKSCAQSEDSRREDKPIHVLQPQGRYQRNDKMINAINANKGLCYTRLTTPLYSLSPVPKRNTMVFFHPPPSTSKPCDFLGIAKGSLYASIAADKEKTRVKEDKTKMRIKNRKFQPQGVAPRFLAMNCGLPTSA